MPTKQARMQRRVMLVLAGLALIVAAASFAYAVNINAGDAAKAQQSADEANRQRTYGLQLICTDVATDQALLTHVVRPDATETLLARRLAHYYVELGCDQALRQPLLPLPTAVAPSPGSGPRGHAAPPTGGVPAASDAAPAPSPDEDERPSRSPAPSASPSPSASSPAPSPSPVACVTVAGVRRCVGVAPAPAAR